MIIFFASFKHLKLPISIEIPVTIGQLFIFNWQLYLQIYFMNILLANLALAKNGTRN